MALSQRILSAIPRCMATISKSSSLKAGIVSKFPQQHRLISTTLALRADDDDFSLGPYPRTEEERLKAARKYNMIPEDYQPYPEGEGLGDYPNIKPIGGYRRDQYEDFDDVHNQRNYGEIIHRDAELYFWERLDSDSGKDDFFSLPVQYLIFFSWWGFFPLSFWFFEHFNIKKNWRKTKKQYPKDGPHYAF